MDDDWVLDIIRGIERERREAKIEPICAPLRLIEERCTEEQKKLRSEAMNRLFTAGKLTAWRTLNSIVAKIVEDEDKPT